MTVSGIGSGEVVDARIELSLTETLGDSVAVVIGGAAGCTSSAFRPASSSNLRFIPAIHWRVFSSEREKSPGGLAARGLSFSTLRDTDRLGTGGSVLCVLAGVSCFGD